MGPSDLLGSTARVAANRIADTGAAEATALARMAFDEWVASADPAACKAEFERILRLPGEEIRSRAAAAAREAAHGRPDSVRHLLTACLEEIVSLARDRFAGGCGVGPSGPAASSADDAVGRGTDCDLPRVTIRYTAGPLAGGEAVFTEPAILLFGRTPDCQPCLHGDAGRSPISRRHCFVEVNPPSVRIRDLGSRNGTFVDGSLIGMRPKGLGPAPGYESSEHDLTDGTEVRLGSSGAVVFTVAVTAPPLPAERACAWCGRAVEVAGSPRPGQVVCLGCRGQYTTVVREAVSRGRDGVPELDFIRPYEVVRELGHGGMGAVHLAHHERTGDLVAIKVLLPQVAASDRAAEMFQREIRNTQALRHRNVVRCLDSGFAGGALFLVLEYCPGGSVDKLQARRGGKLRVDEAVEIAVQALNGLSYAHGDPHPGGRPDERLGPGKAVVHRDIKPANLFLSGPGDEPVVKVGDFGLAKALETSGLSGGTRTGEFAGTPRYMCRKQVIGYKDAGPEVDVWSLAASLYNMLTGHFPRDFPPGHDPWVVVLEDAAVPIRKREPGVPARVAEVIDAALDEGPGLAFSTAGDFRRALEQSI